MEYRVATKPNGYALEKLDPNNSNWELIKIYEKYGSAHAQASVLRRQEAKEFEKDLIKKVLSSKKFCVLN